MPAPPPSTSPRSSLRTGACGRPSARRARGRIRGPRARARLGCATLLAGAAALLAGCGSSGSPGTSADPAAAVPANVALYAGATVRPTGTLKSDALDVGKTLTHKSDPYLELVNVLRTPGSRKLDFKRDIAPWLGPHAGVFLSSLGSAGALPSLLEHGLLGAGGATTFPFGANAAQGAIVLDTSNSAAARSFLDKQAVRAGAHATSYRGVKFEVTSGGVALGVVDRFAVLGSEAGLRAVIEATHGATAALAHAASYGKLLAAGPAGALGHLYWNPSASAAGGADASAGGAGASAGLSGLAGALSGGHAANVSLVPSPSSIALDVDSLGASGQEGGLLSPDPLAAQALGELPGESWLAIGLSHLGATLSRDAHDLQALSSLGAAGPSAPTGLSVGSLLEGLLTPLRALAAGGAQASSWMGSGGVFASGSSLLELRAAVVISSTDPSRSRAAVSALGAALRKLGGTVSRASVPGTEASLSAALTGLPIKLFIADGRDSAGTAKFVLGLGEPSVAAALQPSSTLASSPARSAAASSLGENIEPSLIVEVPTLLSLFEGVGLLEAPPISQFVPYLRAITTVAGGGRRLGSGGARFRLVVGLQQPGEEGSG
ncbi:MAG TPA: DUF3352 domain-containing protein [Solirubrobacteraceae bacterium]|nr:DUF3352 domain-containing protein [Solirubrobacteraceae bacterium]